MGLREAGPKQLAIVGKPQLPREIWEALKAAGVQSAHGDPVNAVRSALKRRASTHGDVFLVGDGKWGRKDWYTEEQLAVIKKSVGGMGGRDARAHSERTKAGMNVARKRGAKPGAPRTFTEEKVIELRRLLADGVRVQHACEKIGISGALYYVYRNRIRVWKEGEHWPPPEPTEEELARVEAEAAPNRQLRVIK
jgi:hypothetical protein